MSLRLKVQPPEIIYPEISSRGTWGEALIKKFQLCAQLGVPEYFIFDPEYDSLHQPLLAFRLEDGLYEELEVLDGCMMSEALGLELVDTGQTLRLRNPATSEFLLTREELEAARQQAEAAHQQAEARAKAAETELARFSPPV